MSIQIISSFIIHNIRGLLGALKGAVRTQNRFGRIYWGCVARCRHTQTHTSVCLLSLTPVTWRPKLPTLILQPPSSFSCDHLYDLTVRECSHGYEERVKGQQIDKGLQVLASCPHRQRLIHDICTSSVRSERYSSCIACIFPKRESNLIMHCSKLSETGSPAKKMDEENISVLKNINTK